MYVMKKTYGAAGDNLYMRLPSSYYDNDQGNPIYVMRIFINFKYFAINLMKCLTYFLLIIIKLILLN